MKKYPKIQRRPGNPNPLPIPPEKRSVGRPKGVPNKTTVEVKKALLLAFQGIGGVERLIKWADRHPSEFYKLYAKLLPIEVTGHNGSALTVTFKLEHSQGRAHLPTPQPLETHLLTDGTSPKPLMISPTTTVEE